MPGTFSVSFGRIKRTDFSPTFVADLINEHNKVRQNPKSYIPIVKSFSDVFPASDINEAVNFLNTVKPCTNTLTQVLTLSNIASDWVRIQDTSASTGHGDLVARVNPYGTYRAIAENISYGFSDPQEMLAALIIDSGVPSRGHRKNIFNCVYDQIGIGYGSHRQYDSETVMIFATGFKPKNIGSRRYKYYSYRY